MKNITKLTSVMYVLIVIQRSEMVGEKAFAACKNYGETMLECHNIKYPTSRVRVPIDLLQFPHMVLIGFRKNFKMLPKWNCGGSLISNQWVLTAAHCIEDPNNGPAVCLRVGTASFEFDDVEELWQERKVAEIRAHPEYHPPSKYHDIALMRAEREFLLSRDIRIACLQIGENKEEGEITAIGFGTTIAGAQTGSQTLMKVNLDIIGDDVCNRSMKFMIRRKILSRGIIANQMCAGDYLKGGRDTCQGDSGGPLQVMPARVDCVKTFPLHKVIGITSFGRDCGRKMAPGVYTRVSKYVEWIESVVWP